MLTRIRYVLNSKKKNDLVCKRFRSVVGNKIKKDFERGSTFTRKIYYACIT